MQVCTICNNAGHADRREEEPPGLRERKRQRTRETIARVALELFDRQGFQETTIAADRRGRRRLPAHRLGLLPAQGGPRVPGRRGRTSPPSTRACATGSRARPRSTRCASSSASLLEEGEPRATRAPDPSAGHPRRRGPARARAPLLGAGAGEPRGRDRPRPRRLRRRPRAADGRRGHADRLRAARRARQTATPPRRSRSSTARCCSSAAGSARCAERSERQRRLGRGGARSAPALLWAGCDHLVAIIPTK